MKSKYLIYVGLLMISFVFMSCKTKGKQVKSREYITESGFSQETTENKEESGIEETTELYKINEHPEDWRINDINTYELFIKALLFNYMEYTKGFLINNYSLQTVLEVLLILKTMEFHYQWILIKKIKNIL